MTKVTGINPSNWTKEQKEVAHLIYCERFQCMKNYSQFLYYWERVEALFAWMDKPMNLFLVGRHSISNGPESKAIYHLWHVHQQAEILDPNIFVVGFNAYKKVAEEIVEAVEAVPSKFYLLTGKHGKASSPQEFDALIADMKKEIPDLTPGKLLSKLKELCYADCPPHDMVNDLLDAAGIKR